MDWWTAGAETFAPRSGKATPEGQVEMNQPSTFPPELIDFVKAFARANAARDIKRQSAQRCQKVEVPAYTHEIPLP